MDNMMKPLRMEFSTSHEWQAGADAHGDYSLISKCGKYKYYGPKTSFWDLKFAIAYIKYFEIIQLDYDLVSEYNAGRPTPGVYVTVLQEWLSWLKCDVKFTDVYMHPGNFLYAEQYAKFVTQKAEFAVDKAKHATDNFLLLLCSDAPGFF